MERLSVQYSRCGKGGRTVRVNQSVQVERKSPALNVPNSSAGNDLLFAAEYTF